MAYDNRSGREGPGRRSGASPSSGRRVVYSTERAPSYQSPASPPEPPGPSPGRSAPPPGPPGDRTRRFRAGDLVILLVAAALALVFISPMLGLSQTAYNPDDPDATEAVSALHPLITEIMASNKSALCNSRGEYPDWIEVTNSTGQSMNLSGYALSDDIDSPDQFVFPSVVLGPGESVVVFASGAQSDKDAQELSAPFRLSRSGESLVLYDPYDNPVDQVTFGLLETDMSWARDPGDLSVWTQTGRYTPGYPNTDEGWLSFSATRRVDDSPVVINEIMTGNNITLADEDGEYWDWIEIFNRGGEAVDLTGYGLSDSESSLRDWVFPAVTLQPGEYMVIFASGKDRTDPEGTLHTGFRLSSMKETVVLSNQTGIILDSVAVEELKADTSAGRVDGGGVWDVFTAPTPGYPNTEEGFNAFQREQLAATNSPVIISEIMSGNSSTVADKYGEFSDWIELYNRGDQPVSLSGYALSDATDRLGRWMFPDMILLPGQYLIVFASGRDEAVAGEELHAGFSLSSAGESVVLTDPDGAVADKCLLSSMPFDMSYGRDLTTLTYLYMDDPTPGGANGGGYPGFADQPRFALPAGCYESAQQVEITAGDGTQIHYTLNGEDPTADSPLYTGPITVSESMTVRAVGIAAGKLDSQISTHTYFIGTSHTITVVNIASDPDNLWSSGSGILVAGKHASGTYPYKGANFWQEWEVPAYVEVFSAGGITELSQGCALRVFGAYSRANEAKCLALMARSQYGAGSLAAAIFPELPYTEYQSLVLRNGASEWNVAKMRDVLITSLVGDTTDLDVQAFRPVVLYLNAEYYGVFYFREKLNKHYIAQHYGVDPESVNILVGNSSVQTGSNADYKELLRFAKDNDLTDSGNYEYIQTQMDIDNYIDYVICEMYCGNTDTGNIKYWMSEEYDGKWRWFFYDVDWAFLLSHVDDDMIADYINPEGIGVENMFDNTLIRKLLKNDDFKQKFLERFAYHVNVTFNVGRVVQRIDQIESMIDAEMPMDKNKWGWGTYASWKKQVQYLRDYATQRPDYIKQQLKSNFGLSSAQLDALLAQ